MSQRKKAKYFPFSRLILIVAHQRISRFSVHPVPHATHIILGIRCDVIFHMRVNKHRMRWSSAVCDQHISVFVSTKFFIFFINHIKHIEYYFTFEKQKIKTQPISTRPTKNKPNAIAAFCIYWDETHNWRMQHIARTAINTQISRFNLLIQSFIIIITSCYYVFI